MPLECTLICLDDSEFMRNGDYAPNRLDSQQDAAALLTAQRINDNAESTVGVMSMAGGANKNAEVLVAPTQEQGKILAGFAWTMLSAGILGYIGSFAILSFILVFTALEVAIAFIQAYIFTLLTCLYMADAIHLH